MERDAPQAAENAMNMIVALRNVGLNPATSVNLDQMTRKP